MTIRRPWTWKNVDLSRQEKEALSRHFQLDLFRAFLETDPNNIEILLELGNLYTLTGQIQEGLYVDKKLVEIQPEEPIFHYNLACSQSLLGEVNGALDSLQQAIDLGYNNLEYLQEDSDLETIRKDSRFSKLLDHLRLKSLKSKEKFK